MSVYSPTRTTGADQAELLGRKAFSSIALGNWPEASESADSCLALADLEGRPRRLRGARRRPGSSPQCGVMQRGPMHCSIAASGRP